MSITIVDADDTTTDDIVDHIIFDIQFNGTVFSVPTRNYIGTHGVAIMTLGYSILCAENYFGSDCSIRCIDTDDDDDGHFVCDKNGNKVCRQGYQEPSSGCIQPVTTSTDETSSDETSSDETS